MYSRDILVMSIFSLPSYFQSLTAVTGAMPLFCVHCLILYILVFHRITVAASMVAKERSRRLSTAILNQVVREAVAFKSPPRTRGGKRGRVYYCTQVHMLYQNNIARKKFFYVFTEQLIK